LTIVHDRLNNGRQFRTLMPYRRLYRESDRNMCSGKMRKVALILMMLTLPALAGEFHKWKDANGRVHFGDKPPTDVAVEQLTVKPNVYESLAVEPRSEPTSPQKTVIMYSTVRCGYCRKARAYFKANGIAYTDYDVETSQKGRDDYKRMHARGVPIIFVDGKRLNGFSEDAFGSLYKGG
jgi:glutaredoxin